jgi:hypothetical protein
MKSSISFTSCMYVCVVTQWNLLLTSHTQLKFLLVATYEEGIQFQFAIQKYKRLGYAELEFCLFFCIGMNCRSHEEHRLWVFENGVLKRIFDSRKDWVTRGVVSYMRSLMCTHQKLFR